VIRKIEDQQIMDTYIHFENPKLDTARFEVD
jgi:hypothetical protein